MSADTLDVRTVVLAQEASVLTLDKARRDQDPLALPEDLTLWDAAGAGPVFSLKRDAQGHTQLDETLAAADLELPPDLRARISALTPAPPLATDRSEEREVSVPVA